MAISQVSLNSITTNPAYANPYAKTDQPAAAAQMNQDAQKTGQVAKTDTVTISQQALQKVNEGQNSQNETRQNQATMAAQEKQTYQYPDMKSAS